MNLYVPGVCTAINVYIHSVYLHGVYSSLLFTLISLATYLLFDPHAVHPSCLGMSSEAAEMALTYSWQCLECKTCSVCGDPGGEEEMVFCDHCDRGYHTFCLDMKGIPEGLGSLHSHRHMVKTLLFHWHM